ncbi:hypothetical protein A4G19_03660 [Pasteurellaceae bacterium Macca]|nr:hypothetical protein [Pasteurellaceae bacterium Macca]
MRTLFEDVLYQNEQLANGLASLGHLLAIVDQTADQISVGDLANLIQLLATASQKQVKEMNNVLEALYN